MRNDFESNYLMHHGILGQKWGIRNYQNPDGSLTEAGRKRYGVGPGRGVGDINTKEGAKKREKDLKKAIKINNKKRGKEYSKIANNPENFLGLNKKHAAKISEYSDYIKKGEEELKRLKILQDELDEEKKLADSKVWTQAGLEKKWQKNGTLSREDYRHWSTSKLSSIEKSRPGFEKWLNDNDPDLGTFDPGTVNDWIKKYDKKSSDTSNSVISESRMNDSFGKVPNEWRDVYTPEESKNISFSIQAIGKGSNDVEFRIHNNDSGISNQEAAKQSKEFLDTFDDQKARKAIADEYYPYVKDNYPSVTKGQFENAIEAYSADTYPKWGSYEVHYDDGGYLGGHSLDIEGDMKSGKIKYKSMNG